MSADAIIKDMDKHFNGQVVRLMSLVVSEITQGTPVDTGWARANWVPYYGAAPKGKGKRKGDVAAANIKKQKNMIEVSKHYDIDKGVNIVVSNNVPYIRKLDRSHKTHRGFVQRGIDAALQRA